jgi:GT2 family glycosyltransferase
MDISVIIPFHSNRLLLYLCLESIRRTISNDIEILVVINNRQLSELPNLTGFGNLRSIYIPEDLGYSKAINIGAVEASGDYLVFCDADTVATSGWMEAHMERHEESESIGLTSSKLIDAYSGRLLDFGIGRTPYNHFHPFRGSSVSNVLAGVDRPVQMACSANMMISKRLFIELGMFDEKLTLFYQDLDLCLRLKDVGKECWALSRACFFHKRGNASKLHTAIQVDERGYYTAKNLNRLENDLSTYFDLSFQEFHKYNPRSLEYTLVDLSTLQNFIYFDQVSRKLAIAESMRIPSQIRDNPSISLLEAVGIEIFRSKRPLAFFVDTYLSLVHNALWFIGRGNDRDLVIDRHANVYRLCDIISRIC